LVGLCNYRRGTELTDVHATRILIKTDITISNYFNLYKYNITKLHYLAQFYANLINSKQNK